MSKRRKHDPVSWDTPTKPVPLATFEAVNLKARGDVYDINTPEGARRCMEDLRAARNEYLAKVATRGEE